MRSRSLRRPRPDELPIGERIAARIKNGEVKSVIDPHAADDVTPAAPERDVKPELNLTVPREVLHLRRRPK